MDDLRNTPLTEFHQKRGARMVPFAGWNMPVQYTGILDEHRRVRTDTGLFDVSHMGQVRVVGPDAAAFLDWVLVGNLSATESGEATYSILATESGGAIDDLIAYRLAGEEFLLIVNASNATADFAWLQKQARDSNVTLRDESEDWGLIAVQGPAAISGLEAAGWTVPTKRFTHLATEWSGIKTQVCRTGYTGEDGVECLVPRGSLNAFALKLEEQFSQDAWCGLGARDSLRLEAKLPLYGHELTEELGPLEARMKWAVDFEKKDFIGKTALQRRLADPERKIVRYFRTADRRIAREGSPVLYNGKTVGSVLSGSLSPIGNTGIGSALVPVGAKAGSWEAEVRRKLLPIEWV